MNVRYQKKEKEEEKSGLRLIALLEKRIDEIMRREAREHSSIHLYYTGPYWIAFERSAYRLLKLFPHAETTPMCCLRYPFPFVMVSVTDEELRVYTRLHLYQREGDDYIRLAAPSLSLDGYRRWHTYQTRGLRLP